MKYTFTKAQLTNLIAIIQTSNVHDWDRTSNVFFRTIVNEKKQSITYEATVTNGFALSTISNTFPRTDEVDFQTLYVPLDAVKRVANFTDENGLIVVKKDVLCSLDDNGDLIASFHFKESNQERIPPYKLIYDGADAQTSDTIAVVSPEHLIAALKPFLGQSFVAIHFEKTDTNTVEKPIIIVGEPTDGKGSVTSIVMPCVGMPALLGKPQLPYKEINY